ncbi:MAG TPA: SRPBCC family protein [Anaeromyxobacteraceae bacterium]|jgi:ribosome-associated toxin RatA of RatAB toxin-antitoxin module|nr:SRPBCC family protein [Anaeromyxobacteraceae bacterium]
MSSSATREVVVDVPVERFFDLIVQYERYPEFVPQVKAARVTPFGTARDVEYQVDLGIRRIHYTLRHVEERPRKVTWSLVGGEMMKVSSGAWELFDEGGRTRARYSVEIEVAKPALVPQRVVDKITEELTKVSLPRMLAAFKARAEGA